MERMRAVRWTGAALTASAAILLTAVLLVSPAFAKDEGRSANVQYVDCSQVQSVEANQGQYGVAAGREARAELAQELGISQEQVNACLGSMGSDDRVDDKKDTTTTTNTKSAKGDVLSSTIPDKKVLAATGGIALPGTAFLALALIGTGLSMLRFGIRRDR